MTSQNPIVLDDGEVMHQTHSSNPSAASGQSLKMTSRNPIVLGDGGAMHQSHSTNALEVSDQSFKMTSRNQTVLNEEALERPPHTGIAQWAAIKAAGNDITATSSRIGGKLQDSPASRASPSQNSRNKTASSYMHIPIHTSTQAASNASQVKVPVVWHIPLQQVCREGAKPTDVCGKYSTAKNDPPKKPRAKDAGPFKCPRCNYGCLRVESVRRHFPHCIAKNGNPNCDSWTDHDSYAVEMARRDPRTQSHRVYLQELGACELAIRAATHCTWEIRPLEPPRGVEPPIIETEEDNHAAWKRFAKSLKEDTLDAQETFPEMEALIESFKEEVQWESGSSDEG